MHSQHFSQESFNKIFMQALPAPRRMKWAASTCEVRNSIGLSRLRHPDQSCLLEHAWADRKNKAFLSRYLGSTPPGAPTATRRWTHRASVCTHASHGAAQHFCRWGWTHAAGRERRTARTPEDVQRPALAASGRRVLRRRRGRTRAGGVAQAGRTACASSTRCHPWAGRALLRHRC